MSYGWDDYEAAPLEFFHGRLHDLFHELRLLKGDNKNKTLTLDGIEMNNLIAKAKVETYKKYPKQVNCGAVKKTDI